MWRDVEPLVWFYAVYVVLHGSMWLYVSLCCFMWYVVAFRGRKIALVSARVLVLCGIL